MSFSYFGDPQAQAYLERIKDLLGEDFKKIDIMPWTLVQENVLSSTLNTYTFQMNANQIPNKTALPLQNGLLDSDLFISYRTALTVDLRLSTKPSSVQRYQWGNPAIWNGGTNGTGTDIETVYNAYLSLNVSNVQKIQGLFTNQFLNTGVPAVAGTANSDVWSRNLKSIDTTGLVIMGSDNNYFKLDLVFGSTAPDISNTTANTQNVVSILTDGFRIPNGTNAYRLLVNAMSK